MKNTNKKPKHQVTYNLANMYHLSQLDAAHKAVRACARYGLTVMRLRFNGTTPTVEVEHNMMTKHWLDNHKAIVYMHTNNGDNRLISTAQRQLCGCRVIFSFSRNDITVH